VKVPPSSGFQNGFRESSREPHGREFQLRTLRKLPINFVVGIGLKGRIVSGNFNLDLNYG
jgi:hypothetical protein